LQAVEVRENAPVVDDVDTEDEGLDLPESDGEGEERMRFNSWNPEDMRTQLFLLGLCFHQLRVSELLLLNIV